MDVDVRYHTHPGLRAKRLVFEESMGDLSRPLASIPDIGEFSLNRLKLLMMVSNPSALGAVVRVRNHSCYTVRFDTSDISKTLRYNT